MLHKPRLGMKKQMIAMILLPEAKVAQKNIMIFEVKPRTAFSTSIHLMCRNINVFRLIKTDKIRSVFEDMPNREDFCKTVSNPDVVAVFVNESKRRRI